MTVKNLTTKPRWLTSFFLIDENLSEYETSDVMQAVRNNPFLMDTLNPEVEKTGLIIFDVPLAHKYKLKLSGGYWTSTTKFISLNG